MVEMDTRQFLTEWHQSMKNNDYCSFALAYDKLTSNVQYEKRAEYFQSILEKHNTTKGILVDLGCGTGSLCEIMHDYGYEVIGVDNSVDMLNQAMQKRYQSNKDILYLNQDMLELDLYGTMDICLCVLDSLNHILTFDDLVKAFKNVSLFLHPDGIFIFDMNSCFKHHQILANNTFVYEYDDIFCCWQNTLHNDNLIEIKLDIFMADDEDYSYQRLEDNFYEKAYSLEEINQAINQAGMKIVNMYDDDTFDNPSETTQRYIFVAKKEN